VPIAALLCGVALVVGLAVLLVVVLTVRRRRQTPSPHDPTKQKNSLLEINDGDRRYVVSYTLKSPDDCRPNHEKQPDILTAPRGQFLRFFWLRENKEPCSRKEDEKIVKMRFYYLIN